MKPKVGQIYERAFTNGGIKYTVIKVQSHQVVTIKSGSVVEKDHEVTFSIDHWHKATRGGFSNLIDTVDARLRLIGEESPIKGDNWTYYTEDELKKIAAQMEQEEIDRLSKDGDEFMAALDTL
jgi:hypothetical protein